MYFTGNKCALSRIGVFCGHETTCSTRDAVQRSMLKAFLLGRNTCWRGFARNKHVLMGYYEEKWQVKRDVLQRKRHI